MPIFKKSKTKSQSVQDLRTLKEIEENLESFTGFDPEDGPISAESFHPERSHFKKKMMKLRILVDLKIEE